MKKLCLNFLLFTLIWIPFHAIGQKASLIIISDTCINKLTYWPLDSEHLNFYSLADTVNKSTDNTFHIQYPTNKPVILNILTDTKQVIKIYVAAGCSDTISIKDNLLQFEGTNKKYNQYLSSFKKFEVYCEEADSRNHELRSVESLEIFKQKIEDKKTEETDILLNEKLSPDFIKQQKMLIDCMLTHLFFDKVLSLYGQQKLNKEWYTAIKEQLQFDFQKEELLRYSEYRRMLDICIQIEHFIINGNDPQKIGRDNIIKFLFNEYQKRLTGKSLEFAWANFIYNDVFQQNYSKDIPILYEQFCSSYPTSKFKKLLEPGVENTKRFHNKPLTDCNIIIYPSDTTLMTIEDAVKPFKGKVIYVDLWATWCGPCKKMFTYGNAMKKATTDMDIIYLYISIDRQEEREKWEKAVYFYNLDGYHIHAGQNLAQSFYESLGNKGMITIPQFVIIGKDGKVAIEKAAAPNELEKVIKQLKEVNHE